MGENREDGRRLEGVAGPALTRGAPELEEIAQSRAGDEDQHGATIVHGAEDQRQANLDRKDDAGFVEGPGDKRKHGRQDEADQQPIEVEPPRATPVNVGKDLFARSHQT